MMGTIRSGAVVVCDQPLELERAMAESLTLAAGLEPIAGYTLVRLLGRGGFGEVWEARAPGDFHVALKFLRLETRQAGVEQQALEVIRNIRHVHLLDVQFARRVADCLVIAMPLCEQTLLDRLRVCRAEGKPGVPRKELLRYMGELSRAVDYLNEPRHRAEDGGLVGVQHRDIKPHNIFLVGGGVRLADFGLAKILAATAASTQGSMTAAYAAPEVIQGKFSRWSDQYSLAATYCELRTGHPPFKGENHFALMFAHMQRTPKLAGIPEEERKAVARALAKKPEERWPTCREFVQALIAGARQDDQRGAAPPTAGMPPEITAIRLAETQVLSPIPPTQIVGGSSLRVAAMATGLRRHWVWAFGLAVVLAGLAAVVVIPRLGRSPVEPLSVPTRRAPRPAQPTSPGPVEPAKPVPSNPELIAAAPTQVPAGLTKIDVGPVPVEPVEPVPSNPESIAAAPSQVPAGPAKIDVGPVPVERAPAPTEPAKQITNSIGMHLTLIPAGTFLMGSPDSDKDAHNDEKPRHQVRIAKPFYLGVTEVTQEQFEVVMKKNPSCFSATGGGKGKVAGEDTRRHPVEQVSWDDAIEFCSKLSEREGLQPFYGSGGEALLGADGYRLPTEAEWEYACRAGSTTRYSFGDDEARLGDHAWFGGNANGKTHPVGQKLANAWGLYDMHGNVWEWCWDGYQGDYYKGSPGADPLGPARSGTRVGRGGHWDDFPQFCRGGRRSWTSPGGRYYNHGFRVARVGSRRLQSVPSVPGSAATAPAPVSAEAAKVVPPPVRTEPIPAPEEPRKQITNSIGMKLVLIPAGSFLMGSPDSDKDAEVNEKPRHQVQITRSFYLGATEVTQEQYETVMGWNPSLFSSSGGEKVKVAREEIRRRPVERVSWNDAIEFCNKLGEREGLRPFYGSGGQFLPSGDGYRLPTEAEWEYACRAGSTKRYFFGDNDANLGKYAWFGGNSDGKTHPVGQKSPIAWGLFDMHGNVWEWCWDWYQADYYKGSPGADPLGPAWSGTRVGRGGSWFWDSRLCQAAYRGNRRAPDSHNNGGGFRVARGQLNR
jgi:formylglycine-generating enzyme required for sulfatase activity